MSSKIFKSMVGNGNSVREARAAILCKKLVAEQERLVAEMRSKVNDIELKIDSLMDFGPEDTTSLKVQSADTSVIPKLQELTQDLYETKMQLRIAERNYKVYFCDEEGDTDKKKLDKKSYAEEYPGCVPGCACDLDED